MHIILEIDLNTSVDVIYTTVISLYECSCNIKYYTITHISDVNGSATQTVCTPQWS